MYSSLSIAVFPTIPKIGSGSSSRSLQDFLNKIDTTTEYGVAISYMEAPHVGKQTYSEISLILTSADPPYLKTKKNKNKKAFCMANSTIFENTRYETIMPDAVGDES
jgi:hypothetical protein